MRELRVEGMGEVGNNDGVGTMRVLGDKRIQDNEGVVRMGDIR
ncbi:hypothetical protein [Helcococcus kunzii]